MSNQDGVSILWKKLSYSVSSWGRQLTLLSDIWGLVLPGETLAIMGPSGSGKTTLLNILADKVSSGELEGEVLINGKPRKQSFRGNGAYVCQENQFMEVFTVRETLDFQASLAQPSLDSSEKEQLVQKFLEDMGLVSCQDTLIGNVDLGIRGISSGQNKRLALAMALISNPNIILLDEPTSKVDSSGALHVMKTLKSQAEEKHKTVVFSIHQPSSEVFVLFDKLLLLSEGRMAFFGKASEASAYFQKHSGSFTRYSNPADQMLLLVNSDFIGHESVRAILDSYDESAEKQSLTDSVESLEEEDYPTVHEKASFLQQFATQTIRLFKYVTRSPQQFPSYLFGLIAGTLLYWSLLTKYDNKYDMPLTILINILFFIMMNSGSLTMAIAILHRESIQPTFLRERFSGLIDCLPFCLAMFVVHAPAELLGAFLVAFMEYYLLEINNVIWFGVILAGAMISLGSAFRCLPFITTNQTSMICLYLVAFSIQMFSSGFVINVSELKFPYKQLSEVSLYKYIMKGLLYTEFEGERQNETVDRNVTAYLEFHECLDEDRYVDLYVMGGFAAFFQLGYFLLLFFRHDGKL